MKIQSTRIFIAVLLLLFPVSFLLPQNNVEYYIKTAFENNPALFAGYNDIKIKKLDKALTLAQYKTPHVSLTANYLFAPYLNNNGEIISSSPDPKAIGYDAGLTNGGLYSAQVNVEKNLFNGGTVEVYDRQTDAQISGINYFIEKTKHDLMRDVTDQYLNCYQNQELYLLSGYISDTLKQQLNITEALVYKGLAKQTDLLLLKVEYENQLLSKEQYLSALKSSIITLNTICGIKDNSFVSFNKTDIGFEKSAGTSNFIKQLTLDSLSAVNQKDLFNTKYYPSLNIFVNAGLNAVELNDIQRKFGMSAGINFSMPIFDGDQKKTVNEQTEIELSSIKSNKEYLALQIENKIKDSKEQAELNIKSLKAIEEQLNSFDQVLKLSNAEILRGEMTIVDYLTIIRSYLEIKKNEISAKIKIQQSINQYNYWNW